MNPWRGLAGLPRALWVLSFATLVNRSGTMFVPFLVLYLTRARGYTPAAAGAILALFGAGALLAAPVAGRLADRLGPMRLMPASLGVSGALLLLFPLARGPVAIAGLTILLAFVSEAFRPASLSVIAHAVVADRRRGAFALQRLATNLGMSIGPAVGGFLAEISWPALFIADGMTSLAAAGVLLALFPKEAGAPQPASPEASEEPRRAGLSDPAFVLFLAAIVPVGIVFFQHESSMALYLVRDLGIAVWVFGLLHTVNTLLIVFLEVPLNLATADWPHRHTLVLGSLLVAAGFGALAFARTLPVVIATVVVWTFGEMMLLPGMATYVADAAPAGSRGAYMGLYTMAFSVAFVVGPPLGTFLLDKAGGRALWLVMLALGLASAFLFSRVRGADRVAPEGAPPRP